MSKRWVASVAAVAIGSGMIAYSNQNAAVAEPEPVSNGIPGSGPCASEVSNETHSLIPEKLEIPIPYPKITTVPYPAPVTEPVRVSQALPADTCTDPCPRPHGRDRPGPGKPVERAEHPGRQREVHTLPLRYSRPPIRFPPPPLVHPATEEAPRSAAPATPKIGDVTRVAKVTGSGSVSRTDKRYQVNGTDLGIMWESAPDQIAVAFGDTVGKGFQPPGGQGGDWRSNVLGFSSDRNLSDGMSLDSMVQDSRCHAAELLDSRKLDNIEITTIPTSGFAVGNRQYMSYMSIRTWNSIPATWWTNYGGIAYSDDGGSTWTKDPYAKWDNIFGVTKFQVASMVPAGDFVYMFGTPNTRLGAIGLARVPPAADVLNTSAYQYWQNGNWTPVGGYTERRRSWTPPRRRTVRALRGGHRQVADDVPRHVQGGHRSS